MGGRSDKETTILEAAARLFARYGPRKTTIEDIAREAGLGKGTIYLYFDRKEEIFTAYVRGRIEEAQAMFRVEIARVATAEGKIRRFLELRFKTIAENLKRDGVTPETFREVHTLPELQALRAEYVLRENEIVRAILVEGINNQEFSVADPALAAVAISAAAEALASPWVLDGREIPWDAKATTLSELLIFGLKGANQSTTLRK